MSASISCSLTSIFGVTLSLPPYIILLFPLSDRSSSDVPVDASMPSNPSFPTPSLSVGCPSLLVDTPYCVRGGGESIGISCYCLSLIILHVCIHVLYPYISSCPCLLSLPTTPFSRLSSICPPCFPHLECPAKLSSNSVCLSLSSVLQSILHCISPFPVSIILRIHLCCQYYQNGQRGMSTVYCPSLYIHTHTLVGSTPQSSRREDHPRET